MYKRKLFIIMQCSECYNINFILSALFGLARLATYFTLKLKGRRGAAAMRGL